MRDIDLQKAIKNRNSEAIANMFIDKRERKIRSNHCCETELWDYKSELPDYRSGDAVAWAEVAKDVIAFHNQNGGLLIIGVNDKTFAIEGVDTDIDSKIFNDKIRKWIGDKIWVEFSKQYIFDDDKYVGFALIPPRGQSFATFQCNSPEKHNRLIFAEGGSALRKNDSSVVMTPAEADAHNSTLRIPIIGHFYQVDEENYRILAPEYSSFIYRKELCDKVIAGLVDPRSSVVSLIGIGGIGKTAIATWSVLAAYDQKLFNFIVSITAKDRELRKQGIASINPTMSSYETLLDNILDVMRFGDYKVKPINEKEEMIRGLLTGSKGLLYVDNLETVDDQRIIDFLNNIPIGCKAITTSRRTRVTVSNLPIVVSAMNEKESEEYLISLSDQYRYMKDMNKSEMALVANNADGIPLAIKWLGATSSSKIELTTKSNDLHVSGYRGNELLEFSFRRIFESISQIEKNIIKTLSLFEAPVGIEQIYVSLSNTSPDIFDSIEDLCNDSIVYRYFDERNNDYSYSLLPLSRNFIRNNVLTPKEEGEIRKKLSDWFEAKDIKNATDRVIFQKIRQGTDNPEASLIDLALSAQKAGRVDEAEDFYRQAIKRNPRSYKALREYAEFNRHYRKRIGDAIKYYEQVISCMPTRGYEVGIIWREYGFLLRDSGFPDAIDKATAAMEAAMQEIPNDQILITSLAGLYMRKLQYPRALPLLIPISKNGNAKSKKIALEMLQKIYEVTREYSKLDEIKKELARY